MGLSFAAAYFPSHPSVRGLEAKFRLSGAGLGLAAGSTVEVFVDDDDATDRSHTLPPGQVASTSQCRRGCSPRRAARTSTCS